MQKTKQHTYWSTKDELKFLDTLGQNAVNKKPRQLLIEGYYKGALNRDNWGEIDQFEILARCRRELGYR